eukprot:CAMPEP_0174258698 /NCGR_PEP_ID=MMETSP0439-20130205/7651_1 /TAXON_ID=0 /ORGANISM="Stereomyxa ramosa, Strain Chinc5" /LENGTH=574 /DNA_ID=CAMNT_0015342311 /DNA_START=146 /DNA_END=1870 /DNA_ORIENTATION=-
MSNAFIWNSTTGVYDKNPESSLYWKQLVDAKKEHPDKRFKISDKQLPVNLMWTANEDEWLDLIPQLEGNRANREGTYFSFIPGFSKFDNKDELGTTLADYEEYYKSILASDEKVEKANNKEVELLKSFKEVSSWYPTTYVLPDDTEVFIADKEFQENPVISKPARSGQGRHIEIWKQGKDYPIEKRQHIYDYYKTISTEKELGRVKMVLQKYISEPALFMDHKFSIRVLAFFSSIDPLLVFIPSAVVIIAYQPYNNSDFDNMFVHLSNYHISVLHDTFKESFTGDNKPAFYFRAEDLTKYIKISHPNLDIPNDFGERCMKQILEITTLMAKAAQQENRKRGVHAHDSDFYELVGFDFMPDIEGNIWALEVNRNPGFCVNLKNFTTGTGDVTSQYLSYLDFLLASFQSKQSYKYYLEYSQNTNNNQETSTNENEASGTATDSNEHNEINYNKQQRERHRGKSHKNRRNKRDMEEKAKQAQEKWKRMSGDEASRVLINYVQGIFPRWKLLINEFSQTPFYASLDPPSDFLDFPDSKSLEFFQWLGLDHDLSLEEVEEFVALVREDALDANFVDDII